MGLKLTLTGLTLIEAAPILSSIPSVVIVGSVIMAIGCILMWLDK
jgi:hypothetical protein